MRTLPASEQAVPIGSSALLGLTLALANPSALASPQRLATSLVQSPLVGARPLHNAKDMFLRLGDAQCLVMLELAGPTKSLCEELGFAIESSNLDVAALAASRVEAVVKHDVPGLAVVARIDFAHRRIVPDPVRGVHHADRQFGSGDVASRQAVDCLAVDGGRVREARLVTHRLVVVLPGGGYGPLGPALRFPVLALEQLGPCEPLVVAYPAIPTGAPDASALLAAAVADQVLPAIRASTADHVTIVAKSLGTRALAGIASKLPIDRAIAAICLTPLFGAADVRDGAAGAGLPSLLVAGTSDPYHDQHGFDTVADTLDARTLLIPNADHGLETQGDVHATIRSMHVLAQATLDFAG